jgi:hypothetical protein
MMTKTEKVNLLATIMGPIIVTGVIAIISFALNAKLQLAIDAQDKKVSATYVTKDDFKNESTKVDDLAKEVRQNFSSLQTQVGDVAKDVATMKGELSAKTK